VVSAPIGDYAQVTGALAGRDISLGQGVDMFSVPGVDFYNPCLVQECLYTLINGHAQFTCVGPPVADGTHCSDHNSCTSNDHCTQGVCGGTPLPSIDDGNPCTIDTCDGTGSSAVVSHSSAPTGTACNDGNPCTQTDTCSAGVCHGTNPVVCGALDQCHAPGVCNTSTGVCSNPAKADGTACDDGTACTLNDVCAAGACVGGVNTPAGVSCSDNNPCNGTEACDGAGHCSGGTALPDGARCGGDICAPQTCSTGQCVAMQPTSGVWSTDAWSCDDGSPCKDGAVCGGGLCCNATANDGASCSDGDKCNGDETCQGGVCQPGTPPAGAVADADPCTTQVCDPVSGVVTTTHCSTIDKTAPGDVASTNAALLSAGVLSGAIDPSRAAVLLGLVTKADGTTPIPNVLISIVGAPELGSKPTQLDGHFAVAVNGGGAVRVRYAKQGYLTVERIAEARWKEYTWLPDVVMTPADARTTSVTLDDAVMQSVRGSLVHDQDGVRQATVLIPAGTGAVKIVNGVPSPMLGSLTIRATEFTVGPNGRAAMPGPLPPATAYTYAVELAADEALDADSVQFVDAQSNPQQMPFYLENFVNFPVGETVPMGYYDRRLGAWVPSANGRVVKILSTTGGVVLATKSDASGPVHDAADEALLGISPDERVQLGALYVAGQTLWRIPITHFTPWDANWPFGAPPDACTEGDTDCQPATAAAPPPKPDDGCTGAGSVIECQAQVLGEAMPVAGTPYGLHYASDRVPGRREAYRLTIPVVGASPPASLSEIDLTVEIAGKLYQQKFHAPFSGMAPYVVEWDGTDAFGRETQGAQPASYLLHYIYHVVYQPAPSSGKAFASGAAGGVGFFSSQVNRSQNQAVTTTFWRGTLGLWDERGAGLGGWSLDAHHVYDPTSRVLYHGDGSRRSTASIVPTVTSVASGVDPAGVVVAPDGTVIFADTTQNSIRQVDRSGHVTTRLSLPLGDTTPLVRAPDGTLYVVTPLGPGLVCQQIKKIAPAPDNTVSLVAGNGTCCGNSGSGSQPCDFEGPAVDASLNVYPNAISGLSLGPDGSLYVLASHGPVRRIATDGTIHNFAGLVDGCGLSWLAPSSTKIAAQASIGNTTDVLAAPDGNVYITTNACPGGTGYILAVTPSGVLQTIAGGGSFDIPDGHSALPKPPGGDLGAKLAAPSKMTWTADGLLAFSDVNSVRMIDGTGTIVTIAGGAACGSSFCGDGLPATASYLGRVDGITTGPDGSLLIGSNLGRVLRIALPLPRFTLSDLVIPSMDGGELYQFDATGRHLATYDALVNANPVTGTPNPAALLRQFAYDQTGRLSSISEASTQSFVTTLGYGSATQPVIAGPFDDKTNLTLDASGNLVNLVRHGGTAASPSDEVYTMTASADGLLATFRDPVGTANASTAAAHAFTYDVAGNLPNGRLQSDQDPGGGDQLLTLASVTASGVTTSTISKTTTQDIGTYPTSYDVKHDKTKVETRTNYLPGATNPSVETIAPDGSRKSWLPDGTTVATVPHADPRFGMLAPTYLTTTTVPGVPGHVPPYPALSRVTDVKRSFDSQGLFHEKVTVNGNLFETTLLADGQTVVSTSAAGRTATAVRDAFGRVTQQDVPGFGTTTVSYTLGYGQVGTTTRTADGQTRTVTRSYYPLAMGAGTAGRPKSLTDPLLHTSSFDSYDLAGRLLTKTLPGNRPMSFSYDANGNLTQVAPPPITSDTTSGAVTLQAQHIFDHSSMNFLSGYHVQEAGSPTTTLAATSYAYTPDRLLKTVTRAEGDSLQYTNSNGRLDDVGLPDVIGLPASEHVKLTYDSATGRLDTFSFGGPTQPEKVTLGYNGSLVTDVTWSGPVPGTIHRDFDNDFQVTAETVANVSVYFDRDLDGLPTCVGSAPITTTTCQDGLSIGYEPGSVLLDGTTFPVGATTPIVDSYGYNGFGEPLNYVARRGTQVLYQVDYTRDAAGRIETKVESLMGANPAVITSHDYAYTYDAASRLTDVVVDGSTTNHYDYDANGNRLRRTVNGQSAEVGTYSVEDQQGSYGGRSFQYTLSGRLKSATDATGTTQYTYDALGNLRRVVLPGTPGTQIDYIVDGRGRRVGRVVNGALVQAWLYADGLRIVAEIDYAGGVAVSTKRFAYGSRANVPDLMIQDGVRYRILSDQLGSPRVVVKQDGTIVARMDYDEFGRSSLGNSTDTLPFGFAGGMHDADTGIIRFGARDYDPNTGRWTAKDSTRFGGGMDFYAYATNDPVNYVDVNGKNPVLVVAAVILLGGMFVDSSDDTNGLMLYADLLTAGAALGAGATGAIGNRALAGAAGPAAAVLSCGGSDPKISSVPIQAFELLKALNAMDKLAGVSPNASAILTNFFEANEGGGNVQVDIPGLTRDLLLVYRELAEQAIESGKGNEIFQQGRIDAIDLALTVLP
jgi:RHS repeat-associated protein